jgi:large subunit ribosomal protein L25
MDTKLQADRREGTGKGPARRLRMTGRVPAVFYGHDTEPISLSVDGRELLHLLHANAGTNLLVDLMIDGKAHMAIAREIQRDHLHNRYVHVDFLAVSRSEKITVTVEVNGIGEPAGVKAGGVIEHHLREIEIACLPQDVPDAIDADITALELGDMLHVRDLVPPDGVEILSNPEDAVLSVITPAALRTEADLSVPGEEAAPVAEVAEEAAETAAEGEAGAEATSEAEPAAQEGGET